jgi:hypothetical protein
MFKLVKLWEVIKINYITVPKEIIYNKELENNRVMVYSYLAIRRGLDDIVGFSCDSIVKWCGYKPNYDKDKINDNIIKLLEQLHNKEYIKLSDYDCKNSFSECVINNNKFDIPDQFALIYLDEIKKIQDSKNKNRKVSPPILLLLLSYLRVNMLRRQKDYFENSADKPEFCYRMFIDIENDIGLTGRYISKAITILSDIGLIATKTLPRYKDEYGNWHTEVTLFADRYRYRKNKNGQFVLDEKYNCNQELQWGEEYIKEKKHLSKEFNQNTEGGKN